MNYLDLVEWCLKIANQARLEVLESTAKKKSQKHFFCISDIQYDDKMVQFYTGFTSFAFFELLGPAVDHLNFWGLKEGVPKRHRSRKIDPQNQLFLALVTLWIVNFSGF